MKRAWVVIAAVGALASVCTGCGADQPTQLTGQIIFLGGPQGFNLPTLPGTVTIAGTETVRTVTVGSGGRYTVKLPPGSYLVTGVSPKFNDSQVTCSGDRPLVQAVAHQTTKIDVYCQPH